MEKFDRSLLPAQPDLSFEISFWGAGIENIAGVDEAGRGSLAGPVVAAALVLPPCPQVAAFLTGVRDSKQMTPRQREAGAGRIRQAATAWGVIWRRNPSRLKKYLRLCSLGENCFAMRERVQRGFSCGVASSINPVD